MCLGTISGLGTPLRNAVYAVLIGGYELPLLVSYFSLVAPVQNQGSKIQTPNLVLVEVHVARDNSLTTTAPATNPVLLNLLVL